MSNFHNISEYLPKPIFIALKHKTVANYLISSKHKPTLENVIYSSEANEEMRFNYITRNNTTMCTPCNKPQCATCQHILLSLAPPPKTIPH